MALALISSSSDVFKYLLNQNITNYGQKGVNVSILFAELVTEFKQLYYGQGVCIYYTKKFLEEYRNTRKCCTRAGTTQSLEQLFNQNKKRGKEAGYARAKRVRQREEEETEFDLAS